jgi:ribonuclease P/MRP protein subunit RPP40
LALNPRGQITNIATEEQLEAYVNTFEENLGSDHIDDHVFDDMKIYNDSSNYQMLSNDISNISKWASDWQLPLNIKKCTVLHIGDKNPNHKYCRSGVKLHKSSSCLDLGVLVTSSWSWSEHTSYVVKRANKIVYLLSKTTKTTIAVAAKLIKSYVRPVLEFGHGIWAPNLKRDIELLESVQ